VSDKSPFAEAADGLIALGYSVIPLRPRDKAPGERKGGRWALMSAWPEFRDRAPTVFELRAWSSWQDANIGMVLGTPIGQHRLIAVDIDSLDPEEVETIRASCPATPMAKRGAKGLTMFYRGAEGLKSRAYKKADKTGLADLLTGNATRQTVVPPSVHPYGPTYQWVCGPVPADQLPIFDETCLERLEDTLEHLGWNAQVGAEARATRRPMDTHDDDPTIWGELNDAALARLDAWVPTLDLYGLRSTGRRGGYEAVATWRPSSTGQRLEDRKRNLQIHPDGIRDFGAGVGYSPLDLVCAANNWALDDAFAWLKDRLDLHETPVFVMPEPVEVKADAEKGASPSSDPEEACDELPPHLLKVPGLVGDIAEFITSSAMRPQPLLSLGAALCLVGTAAGRKYAGPTNSGTHLYVLALAPTGSGKDHPLSMITSILSESRMSYAVGPAQFMSYSAVIGRLTRAPLALCPMDEFGSFLAKVNSKKASGHEKAITGALRAAWGSSFKTMSTPEYAATAARLVHSPALSIFGASTHQEFYAALESGDAENGFLNRFLILSTEHRPDEVDAPPEDAFSIPATITDRLYAIAMEGGCLAAATAHNDRADPPSVKAIWGDGAHAVYKRLRDRLAKRTAAAEYYVRTAEMAVRLATIVAVGVDRAAPVISRELMEWASGLALWSTNRLVAEADRFMSNSDFERLVKKAGGFIQKEGSVTRSSLSRLMNLRPAELGQVVDTLEEQGKILVFRDPNPAGRKPAWIYEWAA
jgi:hypothetical protein